MDNIETKMAEYISPAVSRKYEIFTETHPKVIGEFRFVVVDKFSTSRVFETTYYTEAELLGEDNRLKELMSIITKGLDGKERNNDKEVNSEVRIIVPKKTNDTVEDKKETIKENRGDNVKERRRHREKKSRK